MSFHFFARIEYLKLRGHGGVFDITIAARLIQFMAGKPGACRRTIRLDGISLIKQTLGIKLAQQPPQCFNI